MEQINSPPTLRFNKDIFELHHAQTPGSSAVPIPIGGHTPMEDAILKQKIQKQEHISSLVESVSNLKSSVSSLKKQNKEFDEDISKLTKNQENFAKFLNNVSPSVIQRLEKLETDFKNLEHRVLNAPSVEEKPQQVFEKQMDQMIQLMHLNQECISKLTEAVLAISENSKKPDVNPIPNLEPNQPPQVDTLNELVTTPWVLNLLKKNGEKIIQDEEVLINHKQFMDVLMTEIQTKCPSSKISRTDLFNKLLNLSPNEFKRKRQKNQVFMQVSRHLYDSN
jgi:hypothetical protein